MDLQYKEGYNLSSLIAPIANSRYNYSNIYINLRGAQCCIPLQALW